MGHLRVNCIPLIGSPITHMGHYYDLGKILESTDGIAVVGIQSKPFGDFDAYKRLEIIMRQWGKPNDVRFMFTSSAGATIAEAHRLIRIGRTKTLNIVLGMDRQRFAQRLKSAVENNELPEMVNQDGILKFDNVKITHPPQDRVHGLSGTSMRQAAADKDLDIFKLHLGPMFAYTEARQLMMQIHTEINNGTIDVHRRNSDERPRIASKDI